MPWVPPSSDESERIAFVNFEAFAETVFERASEGTNAILSVIGHDIPSLLLSFEDIIADCIQSGDFTKLLLPDRTFQMYVYFSFFFDII